MRGLHLARNTIPARHHACSKSVLVATGIEALSPPAQRQTRSLAQVRDNGLCFTGSYPPRSLEPSGLFGTGRDGKPPDERTLRLGKTIRILHDRLPTLLAFPLPQEILSPQISLHLFPSTHPHLPTVSGRIAYSAALWTAPVAWGRVPVVGNVRLVITSERMAKGGTWHGHAGPRCGSGSGKESLLVRWRTCGKTMGRGVGALYRGIYGKGDQVDKITEYLGGDVRDDQEFEGLFIFEFDGEGRIVSHTIEHAQQGGNWDKTTRVVNVTDWLLGRTRWRKAEEEPALALGFSNRQDGTRKRFEDRKEE